MQLYITKSEKWNDSLEGPNIRRHWFKWADGSILCLPGQQDTGDTNVSTDIECNSSWGDQFQEMEEIIFFFVKTKGEDLKDRKQEKVIGEAKYFLEQVLDKRFHQMGVIKFLGAKLSIFEEAW